MGALWVVTDVFESRCYFSAGHDADRHGGQAYEPRCQAQEKTGWQMPEMWQLSDRRWGMQLLRQEGQINGFFIGCERAVALGVCR